MAPLTLSTLSHHTFISTFVDVASFPTHAYTLATTAPLLHHTTYTLATTAPLLPHTHAYTLATTAPLLHHTTHTLTTAPLLHHF